MRPRAATLVHTGNDVAPAVRLTWHFRAGRCPDNVRDCRHRIVRAGAAAMLEAMTDRLRRRGRDEEGVWIDESARVGFGHRRLAVIDLSSAATSRWRLPMAVLCSALMAKSITTRIRREIDAQFGPQPWRGHSERRRWLRRLRVGACSRAHVVGGMFALSCGMRRSAGYLLLAIGSANDRFITVGYGEIRLRLGRSPAIQLHPRFDNRIGRGALGWFAAHNCVPASLSVYAADRANPQPGCTLHCIGGCRHVLDRRSTSALDIPVRISSWEGYW